MHWAGIADMSRLDHCSMKAVRQNFGFDRNQNISVMISEKITHKIYEILKIFICWTRILSVVTASSVAIIPPSLFLTFDLGEAFFK